MSNATKANPPIIASSPVNPAPASLAAPGGPQLDHQILALFSEADPFRINTEIFRRLGPRFGIAVQDVRLSLPRVFEDRRFEIISFDEQEIENVLELRSEDFYGFYLSHISEQRIDFVYACRGTHIEWGTDKCVLQPSVTADAMEFRGSALLGLAQTRDNQFVFVVTTSYKQWASPREQQYREAFAHFLTADELAAGADQYRFIWPERRDASTDSSAG